MEERLLFHNPCWSDAARIDLDKDIKAVENSSIKWRQEKVVSFNLEKDAVYTLRGPRQVGKTTLIKNMIRGLLKRGTKPQSIFYYSLDLERKPEDIVRIFQQFLEFSNAYKIPRKYVFLDEITLIENWQYALKKIIDLGWGEKTSFLLTGSSTVDLRKGTERLPGRRGKVYPLDKMLLPMSFREFCDSQGFSLSLPFSHIKLKDFAFRSPKAYKKVSPFKPFYTELQPFLDSYLRTGGFPLAVESLSSSGKVTPDILETYSSVIISDFEKLGKNRVTLNQIIRRLYLTYTTPISWQSLGKSVDGASRNTTREYVELLADSFLVTILYFLDRKNRQASNQKNKKFYIVDSLIYRVFTSLTSPTAGEATMENLEWVGKNVEGVVINHLVRSVETRFTEGFSNLANTFYWRSSKNREIDIVVLLEDKEVPIEIKYQDKITRSDYTTLKRVFKKGIVVTRKDFFIDEKIIGIPACFFLYLLSRD
jgi:hypothetical protein